MTLLPALLSRFAEKPGGIEARAWSGPLPDGAESTIVIVAAKIGLDAQDREADFNPVPAADAAVWLALFATRPLLHGGPPAAEAPLDEILVSLASLGADAQFFCKGRWTYTRRFKQYETVRADGEWQRRRHALLFDAGSDPLPPAGTHIVDGGLIGFGADTAFIFWSFDDD